VNPAKKITKKQLEQMKLKEEQDKEREEELQNQTGWDKLKVSTGKIKVLSTLNKITKVD